MKYTDNVKWQGSIDSNTLWNTLSNDARSSTGNYLGAAVEDDVVPGWLRSEFQVFASNELEPVGLEFCTGGGYVWETNSTSSYTVNTTVPLVANVTVMTNISATHSLPIFLKEYLYEFYRPSGGQVGVQSAYELR